MKLCPRDEVAHPTKLVGMVYRGARNWKEIRIYDHTCYYLRGEYDRPFYEDVSSSHFYVLTDPTSISMFADAEEVQSQSEDHMLGFLKKHASTPFAITTPVFRMETNTNAPDVFYSIPVSHLHAPVYLIPGNTVELRHMIHSMCYTLCSGLTLFLAMVRSHTWLPSAAYRALEAWRETDPAPADLTQIWQDLSVTHPVPMISDFPCYYATMCPATPTQFLGLLQEEDTVPMVQYVDDTDPEGPTCIYASPVTAMFPRFNKAVMDHYDGNMWETPFDIEEEDTHMIDMEGVFLSVLRSRRAWRWWKLYGSAYLQKASEANQHGCRFAIYCLQILFYLYERPYPSMRYTRSRVRTLWNLVLRVLEVSVPELKLFLSIITVRSMVYRRLGIRRWNPVFPINFLVDVMNHYQEELGWFRIQNNHVYTRNVHEPAILLNIFAPYLQESLITPNEYYLTCSLYQLLYLEPTGALFVEKVLGKRVARKLFYMEKIFGMKQDLPLLPVSEQNAYEVGTLMLDYFRSHRDQLI